MRKVARTYCGLLVPMRLIFCMCLRAHVHGHIHFQHTGHQKGVVANPKLNKKKGSIQKEGNDEIRYILVFFAKIRYSFGHLC